MGRYLLNILIWLDQGVNAIFFFGDPDETVSSNIGRVKRAYGGVVPAWRPVMRVLDWILERIDKNHCIDSIEEDEGEDAVFGHEDLEEFLKSMFDKEEE